MSESRLRILFMCTSMLFGGILLAAGLAKASALAGGQLIRFAGRDWSETSSLAMIIAEVVIACAIIIATDRRASQVAGLVLFCIFLAEWMRRAQDGSVGCNCFGQIDVPSPIVLGINVSGVLWFSASLLFFYRKTRLEGTQATMPLAASFTVQSLRTAAIPLAVIAMLIPVRSEFSKVVNRSDPQQSGGVAIVGGGRLSTRSDTKFVDGIVSIENTTQSPISLIGCRRTCDSYNAESFPVTIQPGARYHLRMKLANTKKKASVTIFTSSPTNSRLSTRI